MKYSLALAATLGLFASSGARAATTAADAFTKLKSLAGSWEVKNGDAADRVTFEVVSGGTAVLEREDDMVSVYYVDDGRLLMTHYCDLGNQPRLVLDLTASDATTLKFNFLDLTNGTAVPPHIDGLSTVFNADGSVTEDWTDVNNGQHGGAEFQLARATH